MATYFVSPTGLDTNPGTLGQPWKTPQHASDTVVAGDTVNFLGGTYTNTTGWIFNRSGSPSRSIIFQNYDGQAVTIKLKQLWWSGLSTNTMGYLKFIGLNFIGDSTAPGYGIFIDRSNDITFQYCSITDTNSSGFNSQHASYLVIDHCEVWNVCKAYDEECISITEESHHFEVMYCNVHHAGSSQRIGIDAKVGCHDGKIHHNNVHDLPGAWLGGIYVDSRGASYNIEVYENDVHDLPNGAGIDVGDETGGGSLVNINFHHNRVWNCGNAGASISQFTNVPLTTFTDVHFDNNTFYNCGYQANYFAVLNTDGVNPASMTNCSFRNNIGFGLVRSYPTIYTPPIYNAGSLKIDHNLWYNPAGWRLDEYSTKGDSFIEANPLFVNATSYDFRLQPGSPAIGAGYGGVNIGAEEIYTLISTWYVAMTGNDTTGDGSINRPWRSINKGLSSIVAGDTLYIRAGTYYERLQIGNLVSDSSHWTIISNYQEEEVIIDGTGLYAPAQIYSSSYLQFNGVELKNAQNRWGIGLSLECHYITLSNLLIHDTYAGAIYAAYDDVGYHPNMITHIVLDNVHTLNTNKGLTGEAISFVTVDNFEIKNSLIEHTFKSGDTQQAGIDTKYGCTNGHIHHNELNDCGAGFYCGNINQGVTSSIEFDHNKVHHCMVLGGTGMLLDSEGVPISMTGVNAHDNTFYYNYRGISVFMSLWLLAAVPIQSSAEGISYGNGRNFRSDSYHRFHDP